MYIFYGLSVYYIQRNIIFAFNIKGILQIRGKKHQIQVNESKVRIKKPESIKIRIGRNKHCTKVHCTKTRMFNYQTYLNIFEVI
jgi:hypothetical protein